MATLIPFSILFRTVKKFLCTIVAPPTNVRDSDIQTKGPGNYDRQYGRIVGPFNGYFLRHCLMEIAFLDDPR